MAKMKSLRQADEKNLFWVKNQQDRWVCVDKYGVEVDNGASVPTSIMMNWILGGIVDVVDEVKFEVNLNLPRVFRTSDRPVNNGLYIVALNEDAPLGRINKDLKLSDPASMLNTKLWLLTSEPKEEVFGEERDRALKVYNALS